MAKAFSAIPGPRGWPLVGNLFYALRNGGKSHELHKYFAKQHDRYGPIYYERLGSFAGIYLNDPADVETLFRKEGKYPERFQMEAALLQRSQSKLSTGVLMSDGSQWKKNRSALNAYLMRPHNIEAHTDDFNQVANDLVKKLNQKRKPDGEVEHLSTYLYTWALESIGMLLFERRLGSLAEPPEPRIMEFIKVLHSVFDCSEKLLTVPARLAKALHLPIWTKFCQGVERCIDIGGGYLDEQIADINKKLEAGETPTGLVASLMANKDISNSEMRINVMDSMGAALDTTSNTVLWALYLLSRNPSQQNNIYEEILSVLPPSGEITREHIQKLPYVKAVVKETMRMYPVISLMNRIVCEDIVIRGYNIPAGTTINMTMWSMRENPEYFPEPEKFRPERWIRDGSKTIHNFASIPFGMGPRSCVGRRVAELEMYVLLSKIIHKFRIKQVEDHEVGEKMRFLLSPSEPIKLRFIDRQEL